MGIHPEMQSCIENCTKCHQASLNVITHCLQQGGDHVDPQHIRLLQDCANICATSADFMLRGSDLHVLTCGACAEICLQCSEACASFSDDAVMKACADLCYKCHESCYAMSSGQEPAH
ncbi:MAG: four-helix bundle copper-binding protein [Proteobacteria bacterium]|nr:MAG: four-helix bundle copper-binding protein [Pseudomonadota bacterium]